MDKEQDLVRQELLAAFPDSPGDDSTRITHEDCLDVRELLPSIKDEDIAFVLKNVLIDLLDTHSIEEPSKDSADSVTQYLDVDGLIEEPYFFDNEELDLLRKDFQKRGLDQGKIESMLAVIKNYEQNYDPDYWRQKYLERTKLFSTFTPKQACAIYKWLELALEWENLFYRKDEIESAMRYWGERCTPPDERNES